jgi:hypothetical protein
MNHCQISLVKLVQSLLGPSIVVMRNHHSFWHSSCSACVDQSAAMSWSNLLHPLLNLTNVHFLSFFNEVIIRDDLSCVALGAVFGIIVKHY